jgi:uncharacterized protein YlxW (UPF0749 family)
MKLRPTKRDYTVLNNLKAATSQQTYTKAIMIAAKAYPEQRKEINKLRRQLRDLQDDIDRYYENAFAITNAMDRMRLLVYPDKE